MTKHQQGKEGKESKSRQRKARQAEACSLVPKTFHIVSFGNLVLGHRIRVGCAELSDNAVHQCSINRS